MSDNNKKKKGTINEDLKKSCQKHSIDFESLVTLIESEKVKKLKKKNHYIQQTIDTEIENSIKNEN